MVVSSKCLSPHSMYCFVSTPSGPRPLSAERIVMFLFCLSCFKIYCCRLDRLGCILRGVNMRSISCVKDCIRLSISRGGSGARHVDVPRSALGSYVSEESSPEKNTLSPMSRSNRASDRSMSEEVMFTRGVGMNLSPSPRS